MRVPGISIYNASEIDTGGVSKSEAIFRGSQKHGFLKRGGGVSKSEAIALQKVKLFLILGGGLKAARPGRAPAPEALKGLIEAEAKLGELLRGIDKRESYTDFQRRKPVLPLGITHRQSFYAQKLAADIPRKDV